MQTVAVVLGILAVPLLVLLNACFVAAEFSLVAVRRTKIEEMINNRRAGALAVKKATDHLDDTIAATQLGITLTSLGLGFFGELSLAALLEPAMKFVLGTSAWIGAHAVAGTIAFVMITFLHVILGELVPKAIALQGADWVSLWVA